MESDKLKNVDPWVEQRIAELWHLCNWEPDTAKGLETLRRRCSHKATSQIACLAAATAALIFTFLLAFPPTRVFAQRCVNACLVQASAVTHAVLNSGPTLRLSPSELMPIRERKPAIDFTLPDAFGQPIRLSTYRGLVVVLNFWATWCAPCGREIPWFNELQREHRAAGFAVLGVSLEGHGRRTIRPFLQAHRIDYPILLGDTQITRKYGGVKVLPTTFMIDRHGRVASVHHGLVEKKVFEVEVAELLKER